MSDFFDATARLREQDYVAKQHRQKGDAQAEGYDLAVLVLTSIVVLALILVMR